MADRVFSVEAGVVVLVVGDPKYKGDTVTATELGDQLDRHLASGAIVEIEAPAAAPETKTKK